MTVFCTIITADYYPRALALYKSIAAFDSHAQLFTLVADDKKVPAIAANYPNLKLIRTEELAGYPLVTELYRKYAQTSMDYFRWSLKPVLISYLLETGIQKLLYADCDMFFVNDYRFLFDELDNSSVLLTPHWLNNDPLENSESFFSLFRSGIFTAGFVGVSQAGLPAMNWWAKACHFLMGEFPDKRIHDDQRYLDILPVYFEGTKIIRHRGCTVGAWHYELCKRELVDGEVRINGIYPVIFIHLEEVLTEQIMKGYDPLMRPYLEQYKRVFEESGSKLTDYIKNADSYTNPGLLRRIKWKWRIRTRFKRILFKLAKSV